MKAVTRIPGAIDAAARDAALSPEQRAELERHIPLVLLQLRRQPGVGRRGRIDRDRDDLFQEGCLALTQAIRGYDARRHGPFAPYALARIHYSLSQYLYEKTSAIRVPLDAQRMDRKRRDADRHDPRMAPRVFRRDMESLLARRPSRRHDPSRVAHVPLRRLARERFNQVARRVAAELATQKKTASDPGPLIQRCLEERWLVAEPETKTPLRTIARDLHCSLGRVTHCEQAYGGALAIALRDDPPSRWLDDRARQSDSGFDAHLEPPDLAVFSAMVEEADSSPRVPSHTLDPP